MFKRNEKGQLIDDLFKLDLQFFAEDDDSGDSDDSDGSEDTEDEDDSPSFDELMKDPAFKKEYNKRFKEQMGKRLKKYEGIDPKEFERLKKKEEKRKQVEDQDEDNELDTLKDELTEKEKRIARAERAEKRALVKEFAFDNSLDHKLFARLINLDDVELDDEGNAVNLDELHEELEEEFPQYFGETEQDEEEEPPKKQGKYTPGSRQKNNRGAKKGNRKELGAERAKKRHQKEEK